MTARQLEGASYVLLALGLAGTWGFATIGLEAGTATPGGQIGLYATTGFSFALAAAGTRWMRTPRSATLWLLVIWTSGIALTFTVLFGTRGELLGEYVVFMLPVIQVPVVAVAVLVAWFVRRVQRHRADDL
ncbi:MAG: hypothetical protein Rubg2KO_08580 [Rubricoccaceae bacterium]